MMKIGDGSVRNDDSHSHLRYLNRLWWINLKMSETIMDICNTHHLYSGPHFIVGVKKQYYQQDM
jgi:hypothetical protein